MTALECRNSFFYDSALKLFLESQMQEVSTEVAFVLYENFTALDVFGPVEVLGSIDQYRLHYVSLAGGLVRNRQGIRIDTDPLSSVRENCLLVVPGGFGSRAAIEDQGFLAALSEKIRIARFVLCICTGSALVAKTGALDGKLASTNQKAFDWVVMQRPEVKWQRGARTSVDGKFFTSAGVSAGIDMALQFVKTQFGEARAEEIRTRMEYRG